MRVRGGIVWLGAWAAALLACGLTGEDESIPPYEPTTSPVSPAFAPAEDALQITVSDGAVFPWLDGDWIIRVWVTIENVGPAPSQIEIGDLTAGEAGAWPPSSTFPDRVDLAPGTTATGLVAWYVSGDQPQPVQVTVRRRSFAQEVSLRRTDITSPAAGPPFVHLDPPTDGRTWLHDDGDRIVRVTVTLTNRGMAPITITPRAVTSLLSAGPGIPWENATEMPSVLTIRPNETQTGTVGWYWSGDPGVPTSVTLRLGAIEHVVSLIDAPPGL